MVRTLTKTTLRKDERTLLLPGTTGAEPWELWSAGRESRCLRAFRPEEDVQAAREAILALPMAEVIALPLWLQETRLEELPGMIALQIEAHGLWPRKQEPVFAWSIAAQEQTRTLVLVGVLATALPAALETTAFAGFDLSARFFPLPADAILFWPEQDHLVLAVSRGENLVYFHSLADATFTPRLLQDVTCLLAALRMQQIVTGQLHLILWTDRVPEGADELAARLGLAWRQEVRPEPQLPAPRWDLTPRCLVAAAREERSRRWRGRAVLLVILLALLGLATFGARFALLSRQVDQLRAWQTSHAAELERVHDTAAQWKELQPALDPRRYPLEILLHVSEALPDDVHLTLFDVEEHHVLIRAEAKNLGAAFTFLDRLKKSAPLAGFQWEMAQPHLLGDDVAQLQLEGTDASAH